MNEDKWRQQIIDALDRLPDTADGIADYFAEVGIKGEGTFVDCPLANYLKQETEAPKPWVGFTKARPVPDTGDGVSMPSHVIRFREKFDLDHYPHLNAKPW